MINLFKCFLAQRLESGGSDTTIFIDRITSINGETFTTSDLATFARGILTVNPDGTDDAPPEFISFTAVDSSALSLTGAIRGLSAKSNTPVTANKFFAPVGTPCVISLGIHNILDLKSYIDTQTAALTIGATNVVLGTAGETITQGNLMYLKNDGKWWKCDADTAATVDGVQLGIAQGAGVTDAAITGGVLIHGLDTNQSGLVAGTTYYASNTAGGISTTVGTNTRAVGVARSTTALYFDPVIVSPISIQNGSYVYAADSVGSDAYAITLAPAIGSYTTGLKIHFKAGTVNTGPATLAVNGLSAIAIKKNVSEALATGDIIASQIVEVVYDGTNFQLISKTPTLIPITKTYLVADSPATWTKPEGLKYIDVEVQAPGGGGGGEDLSNIGAGGGGGGGYSRKIIAAATLGATETVTVGADGSGGTAGGTETGTTGGTTSFGAHASATGGSGGTATVGGSGGVGSLGTINLKGGAGGSGNEATTGLPGAGGSSHLGGGGSVSATTGNGNTGGVYGGGGGGGNGSGNGGAGGAGIVIVREYF